MCAWDGCRRRPACRASTWIGVEPIRVPCLYLHGDQDACIGYAVASGMAELFPNGLDRRLLPGVGHFLHLERPDDVNGIIAAYLARGA